MVTNPDNSTDRDALQRAMAVADMRLSYVGPSVSVLIATERNDYYSDEAIARTRGAIRSVAEQLCMSVQGDLPETAQTSNSDNVARLTDALLENADLVRFCHNLALEFAYLQRLEE